MIRVSEERVALVPSTTVHADGSLNVVPDIVDGYAHPKNVAHDRVVSQHAGTRTAFGVIWKYYEPSFAVASAPEFVAYRLSGYICVVFSVDFVVFLIYHNWKMYYC